MHVVLYKDKGYTTFKHYRTCDTEEDALEVAKTITAEDKVSRTFFVFKGTHRVEKAQTPVIVVSL